MFLIIVDENQNQLVNCIFLNLLTELHLCRIRIISSHLRVSLEQKSMVKNKKHKISAPSGVSAAGKTLLCLFAG